MAFEIAAAPTRVAEAGMRDGETGLRIPFNEAPDEDLLRQITRAPDLDHKIFGPKVEGKDLIVRVRTTVLADVPGFMRALDGAIGQVNADRERKLEEAARKRAREEQRRAEVADAIDRDLEQWWSGRGTRAVAGVAPGGSTSH